MGYKQSERMAERKHARRERLLAAAVALFGRQGYHATTVPLIVAEAQSSTGAFYLYFRNKEDVYVAALKALAEDLSGSLNAAAAIEPGGELPMGAVVRAFVMWLAEHPSEARILAEAATLGGRIEEQRRAMVESHVRSVSLALEQSGCWSDPLERAVLARCWVGSVLEAAIGWMGLPSTERLEPERLATLVAGFNLRGARLDRPVKGSSERFIL